jgi:bromodomain and WD repeat domain-containing protein 1/3
MADTELECWRREMRRRPQPTSSTATDQGNTKGKLVNRRRNRTVRHNYRTRAARGEEQENEEFEVFYEKILNVVRIYTLI